MESNVEAALWDIVDGGSSGPPDDDNDGLALEFEDVFPCICPDPETKAAADTFDAFIDCLRKQLNAAQDAALTQVLARNNIP